MAVPVDSFHLLWKEISSTCKECLYYNKRSLSWKDILILLGGIYAAKKTLGLARVAYKQIRVYGFGRVVRGDPVKLYGKWAGTCREAGRGRPGRGTGEGREERGFMDWDDGVCLITIPRGV